MPKPEKFIKLPILKVMVRDILCGLESAAGNQINRLELGSTTTSEGFGTSAGTSNLVSEISLLGNLFNGQLISLNIYSVFLSNSLK